MKTAKRGAAGQQYALIVGLIAVVAIAAITSVGGSVRSLMTGVSNRLANADALGASGGATGGGGTAAAGGYLTATDPTLAANLAGRLGPASNWTLCYSAPSGTAFNRATMVAGCSGAAQLLNINIGNGETYGGAISAAWSTYSSGTMTNVAGFFFTTAGGRAANVYDYFCGSPGIGQVRFGIGTNSVDWINMELFTGNTAYPHYTANGNWGTPAQCTPFSLNNGGTAAAAVHFYRR